MTLVRHEEDTKTTVRRAEKTMELRCEIKTTVRRVRGQEKRDQVCDGTQV